MFSIAELDALSVAYWQGYLAYGIDLPLHCNPYRFGTISRAWIDGFLKAQAEAYDRECGAS